MLDVMMTTVLEKSIVTTFDRQATLVQNLAQDVEDVSGCAFNLNVQDDGECSW